MDRYIELYSPAFSKAESYLFQIKVMRGAPFARQLSDYSTPPLRQKSTGGEVIGAVALNPRAIAFIPYGPGTTLDNRVRILPISTDVGVGPVRPSTTSVADDSYPLIDTLTLYLSPEAPSLARQFCRFATGPEGAKIAKEYGLWAEYDLKKVRGELRLKQMQAGKGTPIRVRGAVGGESLAGDLGGEYTKAKAIVQVKYREQDLQADATREFSDEAELLISESGGPKAETTASAATLGTRAVGVIVHLSNAAKELTLEDLHLVYSGEINKWPGVEGAAARIRVFGLASGSGAMKLVEEVLRGDAGRPHPQPLSRERARGADAAQPSPPAAQPSSPAPRPSPPATRHARVERRGDTEKVVLSVASQPGAIGFVDLARVDRHETRVKLVAILAPGAKKAEVPTPEKVPEGYPLARPVILYLSPKASETAKDFFEFVAGGSAREALVAHGIIPNPNPPKFAKDKALAAVKRHFDQSKPEKPEAKAAPGPEELASVVPKGPVGEEKEEAAGPESKGPSGEAASGKKEKAEADKKGKHKPEEEASGGTDARYFIFGVVGLLVIAAAVIGVNTVAAKRRRERLSRYRR